MNQDSFNDFLRQKAGEFQPSPRTSFSAVEARLKHRRRKRLAFWWSSAAVLLLGLGGWWMLEVPKTRQSAGTGAAAFSEIAANQTHGAGHADSSMNDKMKEQHTRINSKENQGENLGENQSATPAMASELKSNHHNAVIASDRNKTGNDLSPFNSNRKKEENAISNSKEIKRSEELIPSQLNIKHEKGAVSFSQNKLGDKEEKAFSNKKKEEGNTVNHSKENLQGNIGVDAIRHAEKPKEPEIKAAASAEIVENHPSLGVDSIVLTETPNSADASGLASSNAGTTALDSAEKSEVSGAKRNLGMGKGVETPVTVMPLLEQRSRPWSIELNHSLFVAWNARNLNRAPELIDALKSRIEGIEDADLARSGQAFQLLVGRRLLGGLSISTGFGYSKLNFLSITQPSLLPSSVGPSLTGSLSRFHLDMNLEQVEWPVLLHWQRRWNRWGLVVSGGVAWNFTFATKQFYYQLATQSTEVRQASPDSSIRAAVWYGLARAQVQWSLTPRLRLQAGPGIRLAFNRQYAANEAFRFLTIESGLVYEF